MKRYPFLTLSLALSGLLLLTSCGTDEPSQSVPVSDAGSSLTILTSNLTDDDSRSELDAVMEAAGVSQERRTVFWDHEEKFYEKAL